MSNTNYAGAFGRRKAGTEDEDDEDSKDPLMGPDKPEYSFEGFSVEFNDKIVLTPILPGKKE